MQFKKQLVICTLRAQQRSWFALSFVVCNTTWPMKRLPQQGRKYTLKLRLCTALLLIFSNTIFTVTSCIVLAGGCEHLWNPTKMLLPSNTKLVNTLSKSFPKWMQKLFDYRCCQIYKNERTNIETLSKKEPRMFLNVTGLEDFEPHSYSMLANALTFVKQEGECSEDKKNPCRLFIKVTQHNQQWYFLNITPYLKLKVVNVTTVNTAASVV